MRSPDIIGVFRGGVKFISGGFYWIGFVVFGVKFLRLNGGGGGNQT